VALSLGSAHLSYAELDEQAERLAERMTAMGAGPGAIVGLCLPRSLDLIVALIAMRPRSLPASFPESASIGGFHD
jgi:non-ribosomal peptide synthetase component F